MEGDVREGLIGRVTAGALGQGRSKRITATVGTSVYTISPASGSWLYLKVGNLHATALLSVAINEDPVAAPAATPGVAGDWEAGYDVPAGGDVLIPLTGTVTTIRLLSDTATTPAVLNLIA